ncbi:hypothetical protein [Streptomyces sp. NPDC048200]|uniref:hypothetical protein n=1 Tax=Streptomyces sp. NPDC048200 TaxID=3365512 RepID=UPI003710FAB8
MPAPATPENPPGRPTGLNRRTLLGAAASAGAALALTTPAASAALRPNPPAWPRQSVTGAAAHQVAPAQFMPLSQMHAWQEAIDAIGLRATGTRTHHAYTTTSPPAWNASGSATSPPTRCRSTAGSPPAGSSR